jgi:hypothetical protein
MYGFRFELSEVAGKGQGIILQRFSRAPDRLRTTGGRMRGRGVPVSPRATAPQSVGAHLATGICRSRVTARRIRWHGECSATRTDRESASGIPPAWPQSRLLSPAAICIYMQQDRRVCDPALRDTLSQVEKAVGRRRVSAPNARRAAATAHLHRSCIAGLPQRSSGDQIQSRSIVCTGLSIRRYRVEPEFRADRTVRVFHP